MCLFCILLLGYLLLILSLSHGVIACGQNLKDTFGVIKSPNYPREYDNNEDCTYIITSSTGNHITLVFEDFELEPDSDCGDDYVMVFDGSEEDGESLGKYCGDERPDPILVLSGTLHLRFYTDDGDRYKGFKASYNTNPDCTEVITAQEEEVTIKSPNFPNNYPNNALCLFLIKSIGGLRIKLTFTHFELENSNHCRHDYVKINDGIGAESKLIQDRICGTTDQFSTFGKHGKMFIMFISGTKETGSGFEATLRAENILECDGHLHASHGRIISPNYPENYESGQDCEYIIQSANKQQINLTFVDFELEDYNHICHDYVEIYEDGKSIEKFCGTSIPVLGYLLPSSISIVFHSDGYNNNKGFDAIFEESKRYTTDLSLSTERSTGTTSLKTATGTSTGITSSLPGTDLSTETTGYLLTTDKHKANIEPSSTGSAVPIVVGTLLGIAAMTIPIIVCVIVKKRKGVVRKHQPEMNDCNYTTEPSNSNNAKYTEAGPSDEAYQNLDPNFTSEFQYSTAEDADLHNYYSSVKRATGNDDDYELANPINSSSYSMSDNKCFDEAENNYIEQDDSYNVLNIHPAKHIDNETTAIYDRTVDSVYDTTTTDTTENANDLGIYEHTLNISD